MTSLKHIWNSKKLRIDNKLKILKTCVFSVLLHCKKKGSVKNEKNVQESATTREPLSAFIHYRRNLANYVFGYVREPTAKTFFPPFFASFLSHLYPFRVRYQLQMLEPISTVFVTEPPHRNLPFHVLSTTQSAETRDTDQSPGNYRTIPESISPFDATLFLTQKNSL